MEKRFDKIENKLDSIDRILGKINTHLAVYNEELKEHIRRTELLEREVHPIKVHVLQVKGAFKLVMGVSILLGLIASVYTILQ